MRTCPSCGFPVDPGNLPAVCPKCDEDLIRAKARKPLVVDLAHRGETVSQAPQLNRVTRPCRNASRSAAGSSRAVRKISSSRSM